MPYEREDPLDLDGMDAEGIEGAGALQGADVPVSAEVRMQQIQAAFAPQDGDQEDPDEALFQEAFGNDDQDAELLADLMDGDEDAEDLEALRARPRPEPVYQPPVAGAARIGAGAAAGPATEGWSPLFDLPGYRAAGQMGDALRSFGRTIFRSMPCFRRMEQQCRAAGRDPLGEVQVMADIGGNGPTRPDQLGAMANWIRANGMMVDAARIEWPHFMPGGYRPTVLLAATDGDSFLLVDESRQAGAHQDATYIYSWSGGRQFYLGDANARRALQGMGGAHIERLGAGGAAPPAPVLAAPAVLPVPGLAAPRPPAPVPALAPAPAAPAVAVPAARPALAAPARPAQPTALELAVAAARPAAPAPRLNAIQALTAAGFVRTVIPEGPAMRREAPDGGQVVVIGEGKSIAVAQRFSVRHVDATGNETSRCVAECYQDALEMAEPAGGMKP